MPTKEEAKKPQTELAPIDTYALVPTNPQVIALAKEFNWRPVTIIARIERALPNKFEQQVYLGVAAGFRIHPESLAVLLELYRGSTPLSPSDLERRTVGKNLVSNSFGDFVDFFEACMNLVKIVSKEYSAFNVSMELAGLIVLVYGNKDPERVIEMIDTNLEDICNFFELTSSRGYSERMRTCTFLFVTRLLPELKKRGVPDVLDPSEFLENGDLKKVFQEGDDMDELVADCKVRDQLFQILGKGRR